MPIKGWDWVASSEGDVSAATDVSAADVATDVADVATDVADVATDVATDVAAGADAVPPGAMLFRGIGAGMEMPSTALAFNPFGSLFTA
jgi:hypothetical protein